MFLNWIERLFAVKEAAQPVTKPVQTVNIPVPVIEPVKVLDGESPIPRTKDLEVQKVSVPVEPLQDEVKVAETEKAKTDWDRFQDSYHEFVAANPSIKGSKLFIEWARRNFDANGKLNKN
jgi:hypothetical protein